MPTSRRIILLSAAGIVIYLLLSLYHDHQLRKLAHLARGVAKPFAVREQEKNWVQISTADQIAERPVPAQAPEEKSAAADDAAGLPAETGMAGPEEGMIPGPGPLPAPTAEVARLQEALAQERAARLRAEKAFRRPRQEAAPTRGAAESIDLDRLRVELQEARTRAAIAGEELGRARLKAEAMFKYGQEQSRQLAPARQEIESLKARLRENEEQLRQAEARLSELSARERQLAEELRRFRREAGEERQEPPREAPAPEDSAGR